MATAIHLYDLKSSGPHRKGRKKPAHEERGANKGPSFEAVTVEAGDLRNEDRETCEPEQRREDKACAKSLFSATCPGLPKTRGSAIRIKTGPAK